MRIYTISTLRPVKGCSTSCRLPSERHGRWLVYSSVQHGNGPVLWNYLCLRYEGRMQLPVSSGCKGSASLVWEALCQVGVNHDIRPDGLYLKRFLQNHRLNCIYDPPPKKIMVLKNVIDFNWPLKIKPWVSSRSEPWPWGWAISSVWVTALFLPCSCFSPGSRPCSSSFC